MTRSDLLAPAPGASLHAPRRGSTARVVALHCSGTGAGQWRSLADRLGPDVDFHAPEHYGCEKTGPWPGERRFTLADEAQRTLALIDGSPEPVHLVGHSYGGGVALWAALERPGRVASLSLYEPSAFHVLPAIGEGGIAALGEILGLSRDVAGGVTIGDHRGAASAFVDYWGGTGAWAALRPSVQLALMRWITKAPLDFAALIDEPTPLTAYARLAMPALLLRGEKAPTPSRLIAEALSRTLPAARLAVIEAAGHMGPLTHADAVSTHIARHITEAAHAPRVLAFS